MTTNGMTFKLVNGATRSVLLTIVAGHVVTGLVICIVIPAVWPWLPAMGPGVYSWIKEGLGRGQVGLVGAWFALGEETWLRRIGALLIAIAYFVGLYWLSTEFLLPRQGISIHLPLRDVVSLLWAAEGAHAVIVIATLWLLSRNHGQFTIARFMVLIAVVALMLSPFGIPRRGWAPSALTNAAVTIAAVAFLSSRPHWTIRLAQLCVAIALSVGVA